MTDKINSPEVERHTRGKNKGKVKSSKGHLEILLSVINQRGLQTAIGQKVCREAQEHLDG
jgi:hypothetical protein